MKINNTYVNIQIVKLEIKKRNRKEWAHSERRESTDIQRNIRSELKINQLEVAINRKIGNKQNRLITVQVVRDLNTDGVLERFLSIISIENQK